MSDIASLTIANDDAGLPGPDTFQQALRLALLFAAIKFALHVVANLWQAHLGWGYFRDEPYYIMCGQRLDWGYVDHGPVVALQARLAVLLFGKSLAGIRMFSALAGAAKLFLTGLLAWQFGAKRAGQTLAMVAVLMAPEFLALDSFLSMNSFEPVFWMAAFIAIIQVIAQQEIGNQQIGWWILFGLAAGIGCENKPSMVFFLAALFFGLLCTSQRRILFSRPAILGIALALLLVVPNLIWQAHHNWATFYFLRNTRALRRMLLPTPAALLISQVLMLSPLSFPVWLAGLVWLLRSPRAARFRFVGLTYLFFLAFMLMTRNSKEYYLAPVYPILFAAGGCAWQSFFRETRRRTRWILPLYSSLLLIVGTLLLPLALPILRPQQWLKFVSHTHLRKMMGIVAGSPSGPFHAFYALRFGWQEVTNDVTRIFRSLSPTDQQHAGIYCRDYGVASSVNFLGEGRGLPIAISGHNNFFVWGPQGETGEVMIEVTDETREQLLEQYASVELVGAFNHPYEVVNHTNIYLCRGRKRPVSSDWLMLRHFD